MSTLSRTLVLGAGELGLAVITALATRSASPSHITVLLGPSTLTSPSKTPLITHLHSLGVSPTPGDVGASTESELATLLAPFHTVVSCVGFSAELPKGTQLKIARAAVRARVERFVPWMFGADYDLIGRGRAQDLFDEQLDAQAVLKAQTGTEWVIVPVGVFMTFLFEGFWGVLDLEGGVCRAFGGWGTRITATAPEDIGRCVAEILTGEGKGSVRNEVVRLAGDTRTYGEIAEIVERVLGRGVRREVWSTEWLNEESRKDPKDGLKKYRAVFAEGKGVAWDVADSYNGRKGIKMTSIEEWLRKALE